MSLSNARHFHLAETKWDKQFLGIRRLIMFPATPSQSSMPSPIIYHLYKDNTVNIHAVVKMQ